MSQPTNLVSNGPVTVKKAKSPAQLGLTQAAAVISGFSGQSVKQSIKQLSDQTTKAKKRVSIKPEAIKEEDSEKSSKKRKRSNAVSSDDDETPKSSVKTISKQTINQIVKPAKFNRSEVSQVDSLFSMIDGTFKSAPLDQSLNQSLEQTDDQPLWLFSYPSANFDYETFSKLDLNISSKPSKSSGLTNPKLVGEFEMKGIKYEIIEGDLIETSDLITLLPAAKKGTLSLGKPFARVLHINQSISQSISSSIHQSLVDMPPIDSMTFKPIIPPMPVDRLKINFLPVGANISESSQMAGTRRGRHFTPVAYEQGDKKDKKEKKDSKRRKTEGMTDSPQVVKSEKKKKDKKSSKH